MNEWVPFLAGVGAGGAVIAAAAWWWVRRLRERPDDGAAPAAAEHSVPSLTVPSASDPPAAGPVGAPMAASVPNEPVGPSVPAMTGPEPMTGVGERPSRPVVRPHVRDQVRLSRRIVLHLASLPRAAPGESVPPGYVQRGIVAALGANQSGVSKVLRRLEAAGVLVSDRRHVHGEDRRLKVYTLTQRGEQLARELASARRAGAGRAPIRGSDDPRANE